MKIGIMGGTFNPIHNAHLMIAENAREQYGLERIIFMTGGNPPHKSADITSDKRFEMTHIAISDNPYFTDDDFEIKRKEKSYTVHTLEYLREKYPEDKLYFIIGEDSLCDLEKWYKPERILEMAVLLVFPRTSMQSLTENIERARKKHNGEILPIDAPVFQISSTEVRNRIKDGLSVRYLIPDRVIEYIEKYGLYGGR